MLFQTAIRDFSHGSFQMTLFLSQHKPFLSYICIVPWKVWLKGYGSYSYNIYWTRSLFIFFSPVWKYCIVTQERINMSFCTERDVIGHLGAHREEKPKERGKKNKKGKYIWDFCLQWFEFYRNGFGWWAQGERRSGSGRFLENKGRLTFMTKKNKTQSRRGESFYSSVLVKIYDHSFFLSSPASHLPLHHPSTLFAFFSHPTISRSSSSPPSIPLTRDSEGFAGAQVQTHPS